MSLTKSPAWKALQQHYQSVRDVRMRDLFDQDRGRFEKFSLEHNGLLLDYSKNRVTEETMSLLASLVEQADVAGWAQRMFSGDKINITEQRTVLHTALRSSGDKPVYVDGEDVVPRIRHVLERMEKFSRSVHNGAWLGFSGKPISDVVSIGIGGSDLGPGLITDALQPFKQNKLNVHFVSNVEGSDIAETLEGLNPETTLFLVASKGFDTWETMTNAQTAKEWIFYAAGDEAAVANHFIAISANREAVQAFGIDPANMFELWDWVGGRYSVWSAISLSAVLYFGMDTFREMLAGAYEMDRHFLTAPARENIPVILAMLGIWYNNFFGASTYAILPYEEHLKKLPAYLQQLDMESNGKRIDRDGHAVDYTVGPILWGELGGKGQHAFFQLLHQGARLVPADFLVPIESYHPLTRHHQIMVANCFAQTEALMRGKTAKEAEETMKSNGADAETIRRLLPFKTFPGNSPSNTFVYQKLTPRTLGSIMAMYEHKIFTQGIIWNVNSFDQMGVELGKELARNIYDRLSATDTAITHDSSTSGLIDYYRKHGQP